MGSLCVKKTCEKNYMCPPVFYMFHSFRGLKNLFSAIVFQKWAPLLLDKQGRQIDEHGKLVVMEKEATATLKVNMRSDGL